jgi:hypothetical protein
MSRTPDYILKVMDKVTDAKSGKLGVAWVNEDGSLTIQVDPGVAISYTSTQVVKLFPNDRAVAAPAPQPSPPIKHPRGKGRAIKMSELPVSVRHSLMTGREKE